jgi:hypothetical protein
VGGNVGGLFPINPKPLKNIGFPTNGGGEVRIHTCPNNILGAVRFL